MGGYCKNYGFCRQWLGWMRCSSCACISWNSNLANEMIRSAYSRNKTPPLHVALYLWEHGVFRMWRLPSCSCELVVYIINSWFFAVCCCIRWKMHGCLDFRVMPLQIRELHFNSLWFSGLHFCLSDGHLKIKLISPRCVVFTRPSRTSNSKSMMPEWRRWRDRM